MHATIPKGIVGGFEFTVLQRNLREWQERLWTYVCECLRKVTKVGSTATVSGTVNWSYPILPFGIVACTFFPTTFLEIAVYQSTHNVIVWNKMNLNFNFPVKPVFGVITKLEAILTQSRYHLTENIWNSACLGQNYYEIFLFCSRTSMWDHL